VEVQRCLLATYLLLASSHMPLAPCFCCATACHFIYLSPTVHPPMPFCLQIVQFILQNTGSGPQQTMGDVPITGGFCDPYTGGSSSAQPSAPYSRPQPAAPAAMPTSITGGFCDPFTGGAGSSSGAGASSSSSQLPARVYLLFDSPPPAEGLKKKLLEFNAALTSSPELGPAALLTEQETAPGGEERGDAVLGGRGIWLCVRLQLQSQISAHESSATCQGARCSRMLHMSSAGVSGSTHICLSACCLSSFSSIHPASVCAA
jgi:hypothetical protein